MLSEPTLSISRPANTRFETASDSVLLQPQPVLSWACGTRRRRTPRQATPRPGELDAPPVRLSPSLYRLPTDPCVTHTWTESRPGPPTHASTLTHAHTHNAVHAINKYQHASKMTPRGTPRRVWQSSILTPRRATPHRFFGELTSWPGSSLHHPGTARRLSTRRSINQIEVDRIEFKAARRA